MNPLLARADYHVASTVTQEIMSGPAPLFSGKQRQSDYDMYSTAVVSLQSLQPVAMLWDMADATTSAIYCSLWLSLALGLG